MRPRVVYRWWIWSTAGHWVLPLVTIILGCVAVFLDSLDSTARFSIAAVGVTVLFFDQRHRLEATRMLRDITEQCNRRYQELWPDLKAAIDGRTADRARAFTSYLNLCAEEYMYFALGMIHPAVWDSWMKGMAALLRDSESLREFCESELKHGSYYGFRLPTVQNA